MRGCAEHADKGHRNSNHDHCMCVWECVLQMSLLTHSSPVCRWAFTESVFLPLNTATVSFFLYFPFHSVPPSLRRSLLATKAFSAKNKWQSHDKQDKIWFNYRNLPKEFGVWADVQGGSVWERDPSLQRRPLCHTVFTRGRTRYSVLTGDARFTFTYINLCQKYSRPVNYWLVYLSVNQMWLWRDSAVMWRRSWQHGRWCGTQTDATPTGPPLCICYSCWSVSCERKQKAETVGGRPQRHKGNKCHDGEPTAAWPPEPWDKKEETFNPLFLNKWNAYSISYVGHGCSCMLVPYTPVLITQIWQ